MSKQHQHHPTRLAVLHSLFSVAVECVHMFQHFDLRHGCISITFNVFDDLHCNTISTANRQKTRSDDVIAKNHCKHDNELTLL